MEVEQKKTGHRKGLNEGKSQCNASRGIMASPEHPEEVCVADELRIIHDPDTLRVVAHPGWSSGEEHHGSPVVGGPLREASGVAGGGADHPLEAAKGRLGPPESSKAWGLHGKEESPRIAVSLDTCGEDTLWN